MTKPVRIIDVQEEEPKEFPWWRLSPWLAVVSMLLYAGVLFMELGRENDMLAASAAREPTEQLRGVLLGDERTWTLPDTGGTYALESDIVMNGIIYEDSDDTALVVPLQGDGADSWVEETLFSFADEGGESVLEIGDNGDVKIPGNLLIQDANGNWREVMLKDPD